MLYFLPGICPFLESDSKKEAATGFSKGVCNLMLTPDPANIGDIVVRICLTEGDDAAHQAISPGDSATMY